MFVEIANIDEPFETFKQSFTFTLTATHATALM